MGKTLGIVAAIQLLCLTLLAVLSLEPAGLAAWPIDPVIAAVGLMMAAGLAYMALPPAISGAAATPRLMLVMVLVGLALRLVLLGSAPILEIDYYRYLWDGGVLAASLNPFAVAPAGPPMVRPRAASWL